MPAIPFKNLLIHLVVNEISSGAWMALATIENPLTAETAPVALADVHRSARAGASCRAVGATEAPA